MNLYAARDKCREPWQVYFFDHEPTPTDAGDYGNDHSISNMQYNDLERIGITIEPGQCKPVLMCEIVGKVVEARAARCGYPGNLGTCINLKAAPGDGGFIINENILALQDNQQVPVLIVCPEAGNDNTSD